MQILSITVEFSVKFEKKSDVASCFKKSIILSYSTFKYFSYTIRLNTYELTNKNLGLTLPQNVLLQKYEHSSMSSYLLEF